MSYFLILILLFYQNVIAQVENFGSSISFKGRIDGELMLNMATGKKDSQKVYLLSESLHSYKGLMDIKNLFIKSFYVTEGFDKLFIECPIEHELLSKAYLSKGININDYSILEPDEKIRKRQYRNLKDEFAIFKKAYMLSVFKNLAVIPDSVLSSIDIGTSSYWLGLKHLCGLTIAAAKGNRGVVEFCDSLQINYTGLFYHSWEGVVPHDFYAQFLLNKTSFLNLLIKLRVENKIFQAWVNIFAKYSVYYKSRAVWRKIESQNWFVDNISYLRINSYRDEFLYKNFLDNLPSSWSNLVVSFSTLHLMNINDHKLYPQFKMDSITTLGKQLHSDPRFRPYLKRIAFVCYDGKNKGSDSLDNTHFKESLEYKLANKYDFAYVDLEAYRTAIPKQNRKPFYLRPTLFTYERYNWEQVFDGIVFSKDCQCKVDFK